MREKTKLSQKILSLLLACVMMLGVFPAAFAADSEPAAAECLTLAPGSNTTELYVTWYADADTTAAQVSIADKMVSANVTPASEGKVSCRAVVTGLTPGKTYTYQVSNDNGASWSKAYTYHCPAKGDFSFGYVGDPQLNYKRDDATQGWQASVQAMADAGVSFIASVGDNTDTTGGREDEYTNFFSPEELRSIPYAPAVGNHDRNAMFSYHFSYPNAVEFIGENPTNTTGQTAAAETVGNYYYLYNNALFVVLNDSGYPANKEQAEAFINTFDATFKAATEAFAGQYDWLFVQHHKSTESVASHVSDSDIQYYVEAGFEKLMDTYDVDFVMAGHDHVYVRSYIMKDGKRAEVQGTEVNNADGTVYFTANTASGLKYYSLATADPKKTEYPYLADGSIGMANYGPDNLALGVSLWSQLETPGYTIVNVTHDSVTFNSYGVDDTKNSIDTLTITKHDSGEGNPFRDVNKDAYYYSPVLWAVENGVASGTTATTFSPSAVCTRAQTVAFLWRAMGCPEPVMTENPFSDVAASAYYYKAVLWAVENGITAGTGAATFSPNAACTRAQTIAFLWRAMGCPAAAVTENPFIDVAAGSYYYEAVLWAVENGVAFGTEANTFSPGDTENRAQTITFLWRILTE